MELRHLRYFLAVAEEKHFGRAAERLHIVQPALSMQIKALEEELGGPLLIRTSRRVELTDAGLLLFTEAKRTLDQAEHASLTVKRALRGETGRVRIGFAGNAVLSGKLMEDMRAFHQRYPDAELVAQEMAPHLQSEAILAGDIDISYMPDYRSSHHPALAYEIIGEWERFVVMSSTHPLASKKRVTPDMLVNESLILYSSNDADTSLANTLHTLLGHEAHITCRSSSTLSVLAMAGAGLGLALVPAPLTQVAIPGIVYRVLDAPALSANLMLVSRKEENSGAVREYVAQSR